MDLTMKKFASSLLLALTLATPLVMPAVQAKTATPQLKVSEATTTTTTKKSKAKKSNTMTAAPAKTAAPKTEAPKPVAPAK
jgi:hypothetical protein